MQQVGKDAGVRFVLQGSVLSSGETVRIGAQLADTQTGAQLWSESSTGELTNLFALQDKVTTAVVNSIGREMVVLAARESETRKSTPKVSDLMLRARLVSEAAVAEKLSADGGLVPPGAGDGAGQQRCDAGFGPLPDIAGFQFWTPADATGERAEIPGGAPPPP